LGRNEKKISKNTENIEMKLNAEVFESWFTKEASSISMQVKQNISAFEYKIDKIEKYIQESIGKF
jgi:hypothetical protein